ncbi:MAG: transglutaminase [Sphingomonadales bacterium]|nr:MAG: transglutaminase [Sphingomonadales bacterium]
MGQVVEAPAGFRAMCERNLAMCVPTAKQARRSAPELPTAATPFAYDPRPTQIAWAGASPFDRGGLDCQPNARLGGASYLASVLSFVGRADLCWTQSLVAALASETRGTDSIDEQSTRLAAKSKRLAAEKALLKRINLRINRVVRQNSDDEVYGASEFWAPSGSERGSRGDCEDIAIEKRLKLVEAGFDPDRLAYAVVYSRRTGLHTVLIARTDAGDLVLDSWSDRLQPWQRTPYSWLNVQSMRDPLEWRQAIG